MWNLRRKRLKAGIEKRKAKKQKQEEELEDELEEEAALAEPPPRVYPGIPQLKLEEIHKMAAKYKNSSVRLSIKARDAERMTRELMDLRDEVLRLRQCIPATSFENKGLMDSSFSLEIPSELEDINIPDDIEITDLEDL